MKNKTKYSVSILKIFLPGLFVILLISGCGSVLDGDFEPMTAQPYHPFDKVEDHGTYLASENHSFAECTECHGVDLKGADNNVVDENGNKDRSCFRCHNTENHVRPYEGVDESHSTYLKQHDWNMDACYACHTNTTVAEVVAFGGSCGNSQCHNQTAMGPQACNTCHGQFTGDPTVEANIAPPRSLNDDIAISVAGVGVHQTHLRSNSGNSALLDCNDCHDVPHEWNSLGHIVDRTPGEAEVAFSSPAGKGSHQPTYDYESNTCADTYCHGGKTATWTQTGGWTACNSCHGIPPGGIHHAWPTINQCVLCHASVINQAGEIINSDAHVNGVTNMN